MKEIQLVYIIRNGLVLRANGGLRICELFVEPMAK